MDIEIMIKKVKELEGLVGDKNLPISLNDKILALHESATKIWQAEINGDEILINKRIINSLISVLFLLDEFDIEIDKAFENRIKEIKMSNTQ